METRLLVQSVAVLGGGSAIPRGFCDLLGNYKPRCVRFPGVCN